MLHRIDNTTSSLPAEEAQELRRLLSGVAAGNRDDLAQLYRRTRTAVYGLALSYLRNAHDAQDLTQDVYVHIWDTADRYRPTGSPIGWVLAVCRNLCLMHLRRAGPGMVCHPRRRPGAGRPGAAAFAGCPGYSGR